MKPHKGTLEHWEEEAFPEGTIIWGVFQGHPRFHNKHGHTSNIVSRVGNEIETLNSRYTLGKQAEWPLCSGKVSPTT